jgi:probable HAF family extracellular repeat protein
MIGHLARIASTMAFVAAALQLSACNGGSLASPHVINQFASTDSARVSPTRRGSAVHRKEGNYRIVQLPTLGGLQDAANFINERGWVTGAADLTGSHHEHAYLWRDGNMLDLGTLGGTNSLSWPVNDRGEVAGDSVTSTVDPYNEDFCHFVIDGVPQPTNHTCLGYVWVRGVMTALPTLGGNNSQVFGSNNRGQVVGTSENTRRDPSCTPPQTLAFVPVIWQPEGVIRELRLFPGDRAGAALGINDRGQVVGGSGTCAPVSPAISVHALLWEDGRVTNLGGFGGTMNNAAFGVNNRGQVVGFSALAGDAAIHAFLWQNGTMTDLGTLPGDTFSFAFGINDEAQVVGQSCDASFNCRAFIWQGGAMSDLNALVPPGSSLHLMQASSINSGGEIAGIAFDQSTGGVPAFLAIPTSGRGAHPAPRPTLPTSIRVLLQRRFGVL